jgi:hypothetical protein
MGIISHLFGRRQTLNAPLPLRTASAANPGFPETTTRDITRRELVRVALGDVRRRHGLPANWLDCEILPMPDRGKDSRLLVQLRVLHWDENLMKYSMAIQRQLGAQILMLDPSAIRWLQGIVWHLVSDANCRFLDMPDAALWTQSTSKAPERVDVLDRRKSRRAGGKWQRQAQSDHQKTVILQRPPVEEFPETRRAGL